MRPATIFITCGYVIFLSQLSASGRLARRESTGVGHNKGHDLRENPPVRIRRGVYDLIIPTAEQIARDISGISQKRDVGHNKGHDMDEQMMTQMQEKMAQMKGLMDEMMAIMGGGESGEQQQMQAGYARARGPAPGQPAKMGM